MGYYMRFYDVNPRPLRMASVRAALRRVDPAFDVDTSAAPDTRSGLLTYGGVVHAELNISRPGDGLFDEERERFAEAVAAARGRARVLAVLREARRAVVVCVRFGKRDAETTLARIDRLWDWLFDTRDGLVQVDDEGFYTDDGLILALNGS